MKKILITGGAGFIGSHFVRRFLTTHPDWEVINFDKLTYAGNSANLKDVQESPRYRFVKGDVCDLNALMRTSEGADGLIHFAAETHVDRSIDGDDDFLRTNIMGTRSVLETVRKNKIKRYIHVSTDEVYGSLDTGEADETYPLEPNSPYAASKAAGDLLIRAYRNTFGLQAMIVRPSNNYGPYQFPEKVIPLFITNLLEEKKVPLYGRGANRRDWLYVEDNCEAIEAVFDRGQDGEVYNIGGGHEMSNEELTLKILNYFGLGREMIEPVKDRPGHDFRYGLNASKIRKLGVTPRHSFEEGLKKTIAWYQNHADWWQPLRKDKFTVKG